MAECQVCNAKLVTEGLSSGQQFRCANCQSISRFGKIEKVAADRLAWRSLWLGISSIFLLTITGIPAIYYGVRSLLRMRFVKQKRSDQAAAIVGTALGGCFGVFVGFLIVCTALVILIRVMTSTDTTVDTEIVQQCSEFFEFSHPDVIPVRAKTALGTEYLFEFADQEESELRKLHVRLVFLRKGIQPNDIAITQLLRAKQLNDQPVGRRLASTMSVWNMDGQSVDVNKEIFTRKPIPEPASDVRPSGGSDSNRDDTENDVGVKTETFDPAAPESDEGVTAGLVDTSDQTHHYFGYAAKGDGFYGLSVTFEPDGCKLLESDVQTMFESIGMVKQK